MARRNDPDAPYDPRRREFFRTFGRETVRNAGAVIGAATELRRASGAAARDLLDPVGRSAWPPVEAAGDIPAGFPAEDSGASFRSAYRVTDEALVIADQRELPGRINLVETRDASELASAIRLGVVNGGPVLGEVAAYGLAVALGGGSEPAPRSGAARDQLFRAAANTLRLARRETRALAAAVERMVARYEEATAEQAADGPEVAATMRAEADAISSDAALAHAALGSAGAEVIVARVETGDEEAAGRPINLLMHGDMGPLSCGLVGTGTAIVHALVNAGRAVHVWLTEAVPSMEGARIASLQFTQMDVPHTVLGDSAVGWLLASRPLDAILLRGDYVCANGDTAALIGSRGIAVLAASAAVPLFVVAPPSAFDGSAADGRQLTAELRSPAEELSLRRADGAETARAPAARPAVFGVRLNPTSDVIPADLITGFLTDTGLVPGARR